jgi:ferric-dicitrate binding protein FerR (iron transport regulator)
MENNWRIADLVKKHLQEEITGIERHELETWLAQSDANRRFFQRFEDPAYVAQELELMGRADTETALARDLERLGLQAKPVIRLHWKRWMVAASVLFVISTVAWLVIRTNAPHAVLAKQSANTVKDIPAGTDKAILTLADGSRIVLDSAANGQLAKQGAASVSKNNNRLVYNTNANHPSGGQGVSWNTVSTPRGGQYQLVLQDGTKVWLNAASILRYPAAFTGQERKVELNGEGYFEVMHNKTPFIVVVPATAAKPAQEVRVLGTQFNVMAYADEPQMKTTLLEGKVKVAAVNKEMILSPGQQALLAPSGALKIDDHADTDQAIAWKNGMQSFKDADIKTIMRQVSRWYNVDVAYSGDIPEIGLTGKIPRSISLKKLLEALELNSSLHFQLADGKLTVTP